MAKKENKLVSQVEICAALRQAAEDFLCHIRKKHPGETIYAFLFEISPEGFSAYGTVATEEALVRYSRAQLAKIEPIKASDPFAVVQSCFRWAGPEDGWYQQPDAPFKVANAILRRAESEGLYEHCDGSLNKMCLSVLNEMDEAGVFKTGDERARVVLGICYIGGDNSDREFLGWAKQVNPPNVMKRLRQELKRSRKDSELVQYN